MASKVAVDKSGRRVVIATSCDSGQAVGEIVGVLVGNDLRCNQIGVFWMGKTGRAPTSQEMREVRTPYRAPLYELSAPTEPTDAEIDALAESEAIRLAMVEPVKSPADLLSART